MAQGIIYLPSVHTDCYLFFTSADVYDETDYLSRLYPPTYIITDVNKTKNVKCSHFNWIVSYDCMRLRAHDTYASLLQTAQKRCFCINSKEFGWVQVPFSLFGSVCLDIILLSKTPRGNISTKRQSSVIKLSWNRDEVSGIDWLSLCLDAAVAWMSRTGYESIWQGWDRARGQRNRLVRWAQTAIFSFRFSFFNAGDLWHLSNEKSVPNMVFIIMDPCYLEWCCWGPAPPTLTFIRANAGTWRNSLQETVKAWGATLVSYSTWEDRPGPHFKGFLHGSIAEATENQGKRWQRWCLSFHVLALPHFLLCTLFYPSWRNCISASSDSVLPCVIAKRLQLLTSRHVLLKSEGTVLCR